MPNTERRNEIATILGHKLATEAISAISAHEVDEMIRDFDDIAPLTTSQRAGFAVQVARHIRTMRVTVTAQQDYVGKGDGEPVNLEAKRVPPLLALHVRVRLLEQVGLCASGCEGTVRGVGRKGVHVEVDGFGSLLCPLTALEPITTTLPKIDDSHDPATCTECCGDSWTAAADAEH